jgi:ABC-type bacteriocin/lantibiotic exporter with double-glycine peptidase domain
MSSTIFNSLLDKSSSHANSLASWLLYNTTVLVGDKPNIVLPPGGGQRLTSLEELETLYGNDEILMMSKKQQQQQQPSGLPAFVDLENFSRSLDSKYAQAHKLNNLFLLKLLAPFVFIVISLLFIFLVSYLISTFIP